MQVRYQAALRPETSRIIQGSTADKLLAQQVKQVLDFPAHERRVELGSRGFQLHCCFVQPGAGAADGESLLVKKLADTTNEQDFVVLVITPVAASLDRLELCKFLLPVAQHMRFYAAKLADFTNSEVAL